jgi:hypothetical protein
LYQFTVSYLAGAEGKRGIKQLVTVFGDAPDENKELAETKTCEGEGGDYIFKPSANPWVKVHSSPATFSMKK